MAAGLTVGDFSPATHLSVKSLPHYHQVGLLQPATVNPDTGYRSYSAHQIATAQVIPRLRDLEIPVADVKAVLAAPDAAARNALITAHLDRLEAGLAPNRGPAGCPPPGRRPSGRWSTGRTPWPGGRVPWANCTPPSGPRACPPPARPA